MPKTTPEGAVQSAVLNYLARLEVQGKLMFWRQNNGAVWDARRQCYRKSTGPGALPGVPDIAVILPGGMFLGIECKAPNGTQSPPQVAFEKRTTGLGAHYCVARSVDDVQSALRAVSPSII